MSTYYVPGLRDTRIRMSLPSKSSGSGDRGMTLAVELGVLGAPRGVREDEKAGTVPGARREQGGQYPSSSDPLGLNL